MAAHQSPHSNHHERERENGATRTAAPATTTTVARAANASGVRKASAIGADPEDMLLLREKLNQIAVGRRDSGDNQVDHIMDDHSGEEDESATRRRRPAPGSGQFRMFLPAGERPSTPPSSPQPRDVLRKHLRMKSHVTNATPFYTTQRSTGSDDNNSDTASDEVLDGMCVDAIEISPLPSSGDHVVPTHPTVRLSVPEHLRVRTSSYSKLSKCPEGFRKRKSVHMDKELMLDGQSVAAPLKKVSSQVNVLGTTTSFTSSTSPVANGMCDQEMEDVSSDDPCDSPPSDDSPCSG